jgi:uncharacterized protein
MRFRKTETLLAEGQTVNDDHNIIYGPGSTVLGITRRGHGMKIHLETGAGANIIRAYGTGKITVNDQTYARSLVLMPDRLLEPWGPDRVTDLALKDFMQIAELHPEVVLLGTGLRLRFPDAAMTRPLMELRIGLEVMDTAAACRTYNILMGEGRRVAAALMMIEAG